MASKEDPYVVLKEAKKLLKGSFFSKADPEAAARRFEQAGQLFKAGGDSMRERYVEAMVGAAEAYEKTDSYHSASKCAESAASQTENELKRPDDAAPLWARAAQLLRLGGHPDKAAVCYIKAGKCVGDSGDPAQLGDYFDQAFSVFEDEDRARFSNDAVKQIITYLLGRDRFDAALKALRRQIDLYMRAMDTFERYMYKNMLCVVLVLLYLGRFAEVEEEMAKYRSQFRFSASDECEAAEALLTAYREANQEKLEEAKKNQMIVNIDNRIARMAKTLRIDEAAKSAMARVVAKEAEEEVPDYT